MLRTQDIRHLAKSGGATGEPIISIKKISTTVVKSGTAATDGSDQILLIFTLGSAAGTAKCFVGFSDSVSGTYSGMTAVTATTLSGCTVSNTTRAIIIDNTGNARKFIGVKVSNATALGYYSVHAFGIHNKTVPYRNVASGAAATGFASGPTVVTA